MKWEFLGEFFIDSEWQFTPMLFPELIRISHLSFPIRSDYIKAVIAQAFDEEEIISIFNPRRLTCRNEKEIFSFPNLNSVQKKLAFKRLDKNSEIIWKIKIEYQNMLIPSNKPQITNAQPLPDLQISNTKKVIIPEKDGTRRNYLISNLGSQTVYCKYVPLGTDPGLDTFVVSSSNYDFLLVSGEKWLDSTFSQNAVVGITANALPNTKLKAVEYLYL